MQILVVPSTAWGEGASRAAQDVTEVWRGAAPGHDVAAVVLGDGSRGFARAALAGGDEPAGADGARPSPGVTYLETADVVTRAGYLAPVTVDDAAARGSSAALGALLADALASGARRIVLGAGDALGRDVAWADAGAGMVAELARRLGLDPGAPRLEEGGLALQGITADALPDLAAIRERVSGHEIVVASRGGRPLLGLDGLAAGLGPQGVAAATTQALERAVADLAHAVAAARSGTLVGRDLLSGLGGAVGAADGPAGRRSDRALAGAEGARGRRGGGDAASLARTWASTPGAGAGGGVGFLLSVLGARLQDGIDLTIAATGLGRRVVNADVVVVVAPSLDAAEMHDGVVPAVANVALAHAVPVVAIVGRSDAGRREWSASGLAAVHEVAASPAPLDLTDPDVRARVARVARTWSR